jgi:hypothetical protein
VLARVPDTSLSGLELASGQSCRFYVRSISSSGRLSWTATTVAVVAATPAGKSIKLSTAFSLSATGTLTNLAWNATTARLELVDLAIAGVWLSPEIDTGSSSLGELTLWPATANDADDPAHDVLTFGMPGIEADQWGTLQSDGTVGMLMPAYPDEAQWWTLEVRTQTGAIWSAWSILWGSVLSGVERPCASIERAFQKYQVRVTMRRTRSPYRPGLAGLVGVVTH